MSDPAGRVRRLAVFLIPALLVGLGLFARAAAGRAFAAFTHYHTPYTFGPSGQAAGPALTPRVAFVLIDGLGLAPSRGLPFLDALRARGASYDCRIGLPSLSLPGRAVMMTGAWQEVSGQATNYFPHRIGVEHVFTLARRAGLVTGAAASTSVQALFEPDVSRVVVYAKEQDSDTFEGYAAALEAAMQQAEDLLRKSPQGFLLLEIHIVDDSGHTWGAASTQYARAAVRSDETVRRLAAALDLERDTLVVTADHGHVAVGGHGGPEPDVMDVPLVMAGRGVRRGVSGSALQVDIAPTLSVLLGLPMPAANQGRPLLDALDAPEAVRLLALRNTVLQRRAFVRSFGGLLQRLPTDAVGDGTVRVAPAVLEAPAAAAALAADEAGLRAELDALDAAEARLRRERFEEEGPIRARRALLLALLPLALLAGLGALGVFSWAEAAASAAAAAAAVLAYHVLLPLLGLRYSLTAVNKDEWLQPFFMKDMIVGLGCAAAAALFLCAWGRRRGEPLLGLLRLAWLGTALFAAALLVEVAYIYAHQDVFATWALPHQTWGMAFYLHTLALMAVALGAPAFALPALLARALPARARR